MIQTVKAEDTKLEFSYDYMGRRVEKKVYTYSPSTLNFELSTHTKYAYDGYLQIAEYNGSDALQKAYTWVGNSPGWVKDGTTYYFYIIDGNKNVRALVDASGAVVAEYDYNPFGAIIASSGTYADTNKYRFSSEYHDDETSLVYYNFRYYNPALSRWLNRDPIEEKGGVNIYAMVNNNPGNYLDMLGLWRRLSSGSDHWCAEQGDTLDGLTEEYKDYKAVHADKVCLWPIGDTQDHGYPDTVQAGDIYDASSLRPEPLDLRMYVDDDLNGFTSTFGKGTLMNANDIPEKIREASGEGATPISRLVIGGHGDKAGYIVGYVKKKPGTFCTQDLIALDKPASFARAKQKKGPVRCWFHIEAKARFAGCNSKNCNGWRN